MENDLVSKIKYVERFPKVFTDVLNKTVIKAQVVPI